VNKENIEFYYFGIHNYKNSIIEDLKMDKKIIFIDVLEICKERKLDYYGIDLIDEYLYKIDPDIFLIYNDILITCRILNKINETKDLRSKCKFKILSYLDLVFPDKKEFIMRFYMKNVDYTLFFSDYWYNWAIDFGFDKNKCDILYHGLKNIKITDLSVAKSKLNIPLNSFVILNTNRNSYRKAWDITINAFLKFFKMIDNKTMERRKPILFINCQLKSDTGYDILDLITIGCRMEKLDADLIKNNYIMVMPNNGQLTEEKLNILMSACDIGINTAIGEGFGLSNLEHASFGKPQLVSGVGGLTDIFGDDYYDGLIEPISKIYLPNMVFHGGYGYICDAFDFSKKLYEYYYDDEKYNEHSILCKNKITEKYIWGEQVDKLYNLIIKLSSYNETEKNKINLI